MSELTSKTAEERIEQRIQKYSAVGVYETIDDK